MFSDLAIRLWLFCAFADWPRIFSLALWLASFGHFLILAASFQVPFRLGWRTDLTKLSPFNRRLMWTYAAFTVLTIVCFGLLTVLLHNEMLRGDHAALALAAWIGLFWTARLLVDFFYFRHDEWPKGPAFALGHVLLTSLFIFFSATYIGLLAWHAL